MDEQLSIAAWGYVSVLGCAALLALLLVDTDRLRPPAILEMAPTTLMECNGNAPWRPTVPPTATPHKADCLAKGRRTPNAR